VNPPPIANPCLLHSQCIEPLKHTSMELGEHNEIPTDDNVILSSNLREMYVPRMHTGGLHRGSYIW
jgi:hypothetical protein